MQLFQVGRIHASLLAQLAQGGCIEVVIAPDIDEAPEPGEAAAPMVERLAKAKARAVLQRFPNAVVIGSDQVAALDQQILGKPGNIDSACAQLSACSGREVVFFTGLCVAKALHEEYRLVITNVLFRELSASQIRHYIEHELPLDCAGSFKCEGLGISLFSSITSDDPTSLVGLPLIALTHLLEQFGLFPLGGR